MATLDTTDFTKIREIISSYPEAKAELKALNLSKSAWMGVFQALEDWFVNGFNSTPINSIREALDVVTTATTAGQDQILVEVWFQWKQWKRSQA